MKLSRNFKTRRQIKSELEKLKRDYDDLKEDYELQKKKISGERVCTEFCCHCKYGVLHSYNILSHSLYSCLLDCKCKDFERKESEE